MEVTNGAVSNGDEIYRPDGKNLALPRITFWPSSLDFGWRTKSGANVCWVLTAPLAALFPLSVRGYTGL